MREDGSGVPEIPDVNEVMDEAGEASAPAAEAEPAPAPETTESE
jgi:hypothetical protein